MSEDDESTEDEDFVEESCTFSSSVSPASLSSSVSDTVIDNMVRELTKASTETADNSANELFLPILTVNESVIREDNAIEYNIRNIMSLLNNEYI